MKRKIIKIDEDKCNGCGLCVPNCAEGALKVIDGKVRLISDLFCDGLGACLGHCPLGAIEIEEREAEKYDEVRVLDDNIIPAGENTLREHLEHLRNHGEMGYLNEAIEHLKTKGIPNPLEAEKKEEVKMHAHGGGGCPGSRAMSFKKETAPQTEGVINSELQQWPVQLHLVGPNAPYFKNADVLLAADCTAFAAGAFHRDYLRGKALAIACPKLDSGKEIYIEKITAMIDDAKINTLTVMIMEVPCCGGLIQMAKEAAANATRKIPIKKVVIGIHGDKLIEEWI